MPVILSVLSKRIKCHRQHYDSKQQQHCHHKLHIRNMYEVNRNGLNLVWTTTRTRFQGEMQRRRRIINYTQCMTASMSKPKSVHTYACGADDVCIKMCMRLSVHIRVPQRNHDESAPLKCEFHRDRVYHSLSRLLSLSLCVFYSSLPPVH